MFRSPPILVLLGVGDAMGTYQLDTANPELSPIECIKPSSLASVSRYLSQHTTMVRLCGSFPLYITTTTTTTSPPNDYNGEYSLFHASTYIMNGSQYSVVVVGFQE